jgi:hypothetical protein
MPAPHRARHRRPSACRSAQHTLQHVAAKQLARNVAYTTWDRRTYRQTHRLGARDRAANERDGPIVHAHHAADLRTAGAATPAANRPRTPSAHTRPSGIGLPRSAAPPRTHRRSGVGYRHGVEQRGALGHGEHASIALRSSSSHHRSATARQRARLRIADGERSDTVHAPVAERAAVEHCAPEWVFPLPND